MFQFVLSKLKKRQKGDLHLHCESSGLSSLTRPPAVPIVSDSRVPAALFSNSHFFHSINPFARNARIIYATVLSPVYLHFFASSMSLDILIDILMLV